MRTLEVNYMGKKAKVGGLCFDQKGHMQIFVNYCPNCLHKVTMDRTEAEQFANKYHYEKNRRSSRKLLRNIDSRLI